MRIILFVACLGLLIPFLPWSAAAEAPAAGGGVPDVSALVRDLRSPDREVQFRARSVLAGMGDAAGPPVLAALEKAGEEEAGDLIEILAFINYRTGAERVEMIWQKAESVPLKLRAAEALCRFDHNYNRYQGYILSQVRSSNEEYRMLAMQSLGYIGDRRVVEPLVAIFRDETLSDRVRQAAIWDLAHTPVRESAEALVGMVNDPGIEWFYKEIIIAALRRLAGQDDMAPVVSELLEAAQGIPGR